MVNWNIQIVLGIVYLMFDGVVLGLTWLIIKIRQFMKEEEL